MQWLKWAGTHRNAVPGPTNFAKKRSGWKLLYFFSRNARSGAHESAFRGPRGWNCVRSGLTSEQSSLGHHQFTYLMIELDPLRSLRIFLDGLVNCICTCGLCGNGSVSFVELFAALLAVLPVLGFFHQLESAWSSLYVGHLASADRWPMVCLVVYPVGWHGTRLLSQQFKNRFQRFNCRYGILPDWTALWAAVSFNSKLSPMPGKCITFTLAKVKCQRHFQCHRLVDTFNKSVENAILLTKITICFGKIC